MCPGLFVIIDWWDNGCLVVSAGFRSILNDEKLTAKIEQKEHTWALIFVATEIDDIP